MYYTELLTCPSSTR